MYIYIFFFSSRARSPNRSSFFVLDLQTRLYLPLLLSPPFPSDRPSLSSLLNELTLARLIVIVFIIGEFAGGGGQREGGRAGQVFEIIQWKFPDPLFSLSGEKKSLLAS